MASARNVGAHCMRKVAQHSASERFVAIHRQHREVAKDTPQVAAFGEAGWIGAMSLYASKTTLGTGSK